ARPRGRRAEVLARPHRDRREPGVDDGRRRGAVAARVRRRARDLPAQLAVRDGSLRGQGLGGARQGGVRAAAGARARRAGRGLDGRDRKSTRLNSSHVAISYAVFCLKKKTNTTNPPSRSPTTT